MPGSTAAAAIRPISADSHITEPPGCYIDYIEPGFRDRAPKLVRDEKLGDIFVIEGLDTPVAMGLIAAAGKPANSLTYGGARWEEWHRGGWDAKARIADQERDGIAAEMIYPSVGMMLCNHPDFDYKHACFQAYNRWLQNFCQDAPDRVYGLGQTALRSVEEGIEDFRRIKAMGFKGVMMPGNPKVEDYDHPAYDPLWEAAVDLKLPLSFHILTSRNDRGTPRGPRINGFMSIIRGCQDILGTFVFGGVFERHPKLKVVCVEADAGWAPHFMYRMDHAYNRHRHWMKGKELAKAPSEYFRENIYLTFQDDWVAFKVRDLCNVRRLMWANDFPHSDSTWPWSQEILAEHAKDLSEQERRWVLRDNVAELYGLEAH
ncbi:MAG TPA: amidohydrolase family protein [Candidatus Cybelea sp.]|nr:amidohydrolase family protein [Candidatus Cybelea sp.]